MLFVIITLVAVVMAIVAINNSKNHNGHGANTVETVIRTATEGGYGVEAKAWCRGKATHLAHYVMSKIAHILCTVSFYIRKTLKVAFMLPLMLLMGAIPRTDPGRKPGGNKRKESHKMELNPIKARTQRLITLADAINRGVATDTEKAEYSAIVAEIKAEAEGGYKPADGLNTKVEGFMPAEREDHSAPFVVYRKGKIMKFAKGATKTKSKKASWAEDITVAKAAYLADPTTTNRSWLEALIDEDEIVKIEAEAKNIAAATKALGYDASLKTRAYNPIDYKAELVLSFGSPTEKADAEAYLAAKAAMATAAADESKAEVAEAEAEAGIFYRYMISGQETAKSDDFKAYTVAIESANIVLAIEGEIASKTKAISFARKSEKVGLDRKVLASYQAEATKANAEAKRIAELVGKIETSLDNACRNAGIQPAQEVVDLIKAYKTGKDIANCVESAKNLIRNVKSITFAFTSERRNDKTCSLYKAVVDHADLFIDWLNGFSAGEWKEVPSERFGTQLRYFAQRPEDREKEAARRQKGFAYGISGKLVSTATDSKGHEYLRRGVRGVGDIETAVIGYFGDINSAFASNGIARARAITDILDTKLDNGKTLRDYLTELRELRETRAVKRKTDAEVEFDLTGGTSLYAAISDAYSRIMAERNEDEDRAIRDGLIESEVAQRAFVKAVYEHIEQIGKLIFDTVSIMIDDKRITKANTVLGKEFGGNVSIRAHAAKYQKATADMYHVKDMIRKELNYTWDGDESNFVAAVLHCFKIAQKYDKGENGDKWIHMYATAAKASGITEDEVFDYLAPTKDGSNWAVVERTFKACSVTKTMAMSMVLGKVPGTWDTCVNERPEEAYVGPTGIYEAYALIGKDKEGNLPGYSDIMFDDQTEIIETAEDRKIAFPAACYDDARQEIIDTIRDGRSIVLWYGKLIRNTYGSQYDGEIREVFPDWMNGIRTNEKPWEIYPIGDMIPSNREFQIAAGEQFGNKETVITAESVEDFDLWLKATQAAYLKWDTFRKAVVVPAETTYNVLKNNHKAEKAELEAARTTYENAKAELKKLSVLGKRAGSQCLMDILCREGYDTHNEVTEAHDHQREIFG